MSEDLVTLIWLGGGLLVATAELVVPGGVVGFLGASAVLVAGLRWAGLIDGLAASFAWWMVLSVGLIVSLRGLVQRWSGAERSVGSTDEDADAYGATAEVVAEVDAVSDAGRIRFHGTTWPARSVRGELPPGLPVRIVHRDNLVWIVEPLVPLGEPQTASRPEPRATSHTKPQS